MIAAGCLSGLALALLVGSLVRLASDADVAHRRDADSCWLDTPRVLVCQRILQVGDAQGGWRPVRIVQRHRVAVREVLEGQEMILVEEGR